MKVSIKSTFSLLYQKGHTKKKTYNQFYIEYPLIMQCPKFTSLEPAIVAAYLLIKIITDPEYKDHRLNKELSTIIISEPRSQ